MSDGSAPGTLRPCTSRLMRRTCRTESGRIALQLSSFASSRLSERLAVRPLLAVAAGLLHAYSLASPVDGSTTWWAQILSLTVLAGLIPSGTGARRAAGFAALFGMSWMAGTFWWLFISLHVYGGRNTASPRTSAMKICSARNLPSVFAIRPRPPPCSRTSATSRGSVTRQRFRSTCTSVGFVPWSSAAP